MKDLPYFKCFPEKWLSGDISTFGATEQGIFLNLCLLTWKNAGKLEVNDRALCRRLKVSAEVLKAAMSDFLDCGILELSDSGVYRIKFIDEQLSEFASFSESKRIAAHSRWDARAMRKNAPALQKDACASVCNATQEEDKDKDKEKDNTPPIIPQGDLFSSFQTRLNALYSRKETTSWSDKERKKLREIVRRQDAETELGEIEGLYNSGYEYFRRDIATLLNNWTGEVDKARIHGFKKQEVEDGVGNKA